MNDFARKVVIVTGGAKGIGRATSTAFVKVDARVVIADIDEDAGRRLVEEIDPSGERSRFVPSDVAKAKDAARAVDTAVEAFGGADILINNVGIQPIDSYKNVEELSEEMWDRVLAVNTKSHFLMAKYSIPNMKKRGGGVIISVASVQGLQSQKLVPAYAASKGAVLSLVHNLALDYAEHNIRVLAVCPGSIDTPMVRAEAARVSPDDVEGAIRQFGSCHPLGRIGRPEEVADLVLFLASEKASFLTGEAVCVDGGLMAKGAWSN